MHTHNKSTYSRERHGVGRYLRVGLVLAFGASATSAACAAAAAARALPGVVVVQPEGRLGKAGALNIGVERSRHPVLVMTDMFSRFGSLFERLSNDTQFCL